MIASMRMRPVLENPRHAGLASPTDRRPASGWRQQPDREMEQRSGKVNRPQGALGLFLGADASQLGLENPKREEDRERKADDPGDVGERHLAQQRDVLGEEESEDQRQNGADFGRADEHGLPFNKPHWPTLADASCGASNSLRSS
jgi:hypothetical protein